jgi:catechol 2,3-dioxygenase-like lactoylglutathione lyase family enzyme
VICYREKTMAFSSVMPNLYVADVERSAAFYRDLLGGTETFRLPAEGGPSTWSCGSARS